MQFLGIPDPSVWIAYVGVILSMILCVVYGAVNWNKEGDISPEEEVEEKNWAKEEKELDEEVADGGTE